MKRFFTCLGLCVLLFGTPHTLIIAQTSEPAPKPQIRSDEEDNKKVLPPSEVVNWGIGLYGGLRGTVNTAFQPFEFTNSPSVFVGQNGVTLDIQPQADFGITLYAPMLFAEKAGVNLDIGLSTYSFGTLLWPRYILNDLARQRYLDSNVGKNISKDNIVKEETAKFQTTLQFLNISPMLNLGGFLLGVNIGLPLPFLTSSIQTQTSRALKLSEQTQTIASNNLQLFVEPRIGVQVALFSIKNVGTFFLNANASYALFGSPLSVSALLTANTQVEKALTDLGYKPADFRFPASDSARARFDAISIRPLSVSVGLSFIFNFTNKDTQDEFIREERKADSIRSLAIKAQGQQEYLRNKSIALADSAINLIVASSKISERIAKAEKAVIEKQKQVISTELTETKKKVFQANLTTITGTKEDGTQVEDPTLRVEQFAASTQRTLLPVVFFDQGSATPPSRYRRIQSSEREAYKLPSDANAAPTVVYTHLLNIIGKRLSSSPSAKLTITGQQTRDETDAKLAEKRAEAIAAYLQDVWKIPASRLTRTAKPADASNQADKRTVSFTSDNAEILAPLTIDYTTRLASPPVLNIGMEINTGAGLKQWELEMQQMVNNQPTTLKEARGGEPYPQRYEWRLNDEPATIPQSNDPVSIRISAYDINNAAAPDAALKSIKVEQISLADKRKNNAPDKSVSLYEALFGASLSDMDASSKAAFDAAKRTITPQSRVSITVYGGNTSVNARAVAQALNLDARTAILRDAGTPLLSNTQQLEAQAYNRMIRIRVESPVK
ncbi:MAG: hypothetical protein JNN25_06225 [Candidatus Kapabacteria bacterium]|nr:hypothetical protein [Candidatus Kapabacteria bacterium]